MKKIIVICLVLLLNNAFSMGHLPRFIRNSPLAPPPSYRTRIPQVSTEYFIQKLDHFDSNDNTTWSQKYFVSTKFFDNSRNNVAFLVLGGAQDRLMDGSWATSARKYGALMFKLEPRFYGESVPFPDLATENLRYLSSQQALADTANFIRSMNEKYSLAPDVKWIVFGASYFGSLAAWMRLKYPELVYGAVSISAPLLAKLDFSEYFSAIIDNLAITGGQHCVSSLKAATSQVDELLSNPNSDETVTSIFNLCEPIEELDRNDLSIDNFYDKLATPFEMAAEFGLLNFLCRDMNDITKKEIYRLAQVMQKTYRKHECLDYSHQNYIETLRDIINKARLWNYQLCTEFGWFQTTNRDDRVFARGHSIDMYTSWCEDVYGPEFNATFIKNQIDRTNADYGGTNINVSNVVYVHCSRNPWNAVGLLQTTNPESPVIIIEGTSVLCAAMSSKVASTVPELSTAIEEVDSIIGGWLGFK